jgi:hypothetical protein
MDTRFSPVTQLAMFQPNTIVDLCGKGGHFAPDTRSAAEKMLVKLVRGNLILQVSRFYPRKFINWFTCDWADWIRTYTFITLGHNPLTGGEGYEGLGSSARMRRSSTLSNAFYTYRVNLWRPPDARQRSVQCLSDGVSIVRSSSSYAKATATRR